MQSEPFPVSPDEARSLRLMVFDFDGVFTDNAVYVAQDGSEAVRCTRADGLGLRKLEAVGLELLILSTETNPVVAARAGKLRLNYIQGCEDKGVRLRELVQERGLTLTQVAYMGNDINDEECLRIVGLPIVVGDAHPDVLHLGRYRTRLPGGHGAVREVCDLLARLLDSE